MSRTDCVIKVEFSDGTEVALGADDELYVTLAEGVNTAILNDDRLALIKRLQEHEDGD